MAERMQSMFSRAVEEQLSEQRQVAGVLAQVQDQLGRLAEQLQEMRLLGERVDGVARLVQERGRDLAEQRTAIAELKTAVDQHTHAVIGGTEGGSPGAPPGLEGLVSGVGALQQRAEALDAGLRELRQAFSGVAARAAQLPGREDIDAIRERLDTLDAVTTRLDALHEE